ncbi:MAG TPA: serine kinase [Bacillota bacterium]|nr:serine kinase [Bacillota bacterium]
MTLERIIEELGLKRLTPPGTGEQREVRWGYCSDLLSDVMAHAQSGDVWITLQTHQNIVAVAMMTDVAGVIFPRGLPPDADTLEKATAEAVPLLSSERTAFELAGRLYALVAGERDES